MRLILPFVAAGMIGSWPQTTLSQANTDDSASVGNVVTRFHDALARGDAAGALGLLADDAVILEAGSIETRAAYEQHHLPEDIRFARAVASKRSPARVVVSGDVAWSTSTSESKGTFEGRPIDTVGAELVVLGRTATGWQIRAIHWSSRRRAR